uniref:Uncharacterized protein n=1 Tax=Amphimedon queenslandica TaxID=400682 RepID=A0A1X7SYP4_AMPQE
MLTLNMAALEPVGTDSFSYREEKKVDDENDGVTNDSKITDEEFYESLADKHSIMKYTSK